MDGNKKTPSEYEAEALKKWYDESSNTTKKVAILRKYSIIIRIVICVAWYAFVGFLYKDYRIGQGSKWDDWGSSILIILFIVGFNLLYPKYIDHLEKKIQVGEETTKQDIAMYRSKYLEEEEKIAQRRTMEIESLHGTMRDLECYQTDILPFMRALNTINEEKELEGIIESVEHHRLIIQEKCQSVNMKAQKLGVKDRIYIDGKGEKENFPKDGTNKLNYPAEVLEATLPDESLQQSILFYDGLYCCCGSFLRFYQDGTVIGVSSTGNSSQVARWFGKNTRDISMGRYSINKDFINFSIDSSLGSVEYHGKIISPRLLILNTHSLINDYRATNQEYVFAKVKLLPE